MAENFSLKPILMFFVVILIGIVFLGEIADNQIKNTELSGVTNESIAIVSGSGQTANVDLTSLSFFGNATVNTDSGNALTLGESVNFTKVGVISTNITADDNYNISYQYEGDLYVVDGTTHPLLKLLTIFFVLVIFAFGIAAIRDSSDNFNFGFNK